MIIAGLDPGLGVKSATGVAFIDTLSMSFVTFELWTKNKKDKNPVKYTYLHNKVYKLMLEHNPDIICFESFVMLGVSGQSLQRLIGALMAASPDSSKIVEVANTVVKQVIGGSGRSEKEELANGLHAYFIKKNKSSAEQVLELKFAQKWDELDALAIAVAGYLRNTT
jgi:Holliday junction resolvasome RuvABC endonuclease subunit